MKSVAGGQGFGHLRICGCSVDPASAPSCLSIFIPAPTKTTTKPKGLVAVFVAGGQGFEPQLPHPECEVLPLDDPPIIN